MPKISNITCVIIAKNAEETISETLQSLQDFNEVILYLNNSDDETEKIADAFENVKVIQGDFLGFGPTKNKACEYAQNDWILSLDSDEVLSPDLFRELYKLQLSDSSTVFKIKRDNYFLGKKVHYSGWGDDYLVRLFNKTTHNFNNNMVHEFVALTAETKYSSRRLKYTERCYIYNARRV